MISYKNAVITMVFIKIEGFKNICFTAFAYGVSLSKLSKDIIKIDSAHLPHWRWKCGVDLSLNNI